MSEENINLEENTAKAFEKLRENMPSIGFISRKKRIKGYIQVTEIAQYMISSKEMTDEGALLVLSVMMRKCSDFQKAAMMTALSLNTIEKNILSPIGLTFILEVRNNLNLPSTHHSDKKTISSTEKNEQV
ncbi:MAG: hypothetical protein GQ529_08160 [Methyloprofundus sp.]|nr:hypothetical protein [Methyloprofundus sp.]